VNLKKTCEGKKNCSVKRTNCKFQGPIHKETSHTKCHWKKDGKKSQKRQCCTWRVLCVGSKCSDLKKTCSLIGKSAVKGESYAGASCKWRLSKTKKGLFKRQFCCRSTLECNPHDEGASCKKVKECSWFGKRVALGKIFFKKSVSCKKMEKQKFVVKKFSNANQKLIVKLLKTVAKKRLRNQKENSLLVLLLENPMLKHSKRKFFKTSLKDHSNLLKIDMFQFIQ